jgi:hypothetical protein
LASKPKDGSTLPQQKTFLSSTVSAAKLNPSDGLAGRLIDRIVKAKHTDSRDVTLAEMREKRCATARKSLDEHEKRCSAALIAAAGKFSLDENILAYVRHSKEQEELTVKDSIPITCK